MKKLVYSLALGLTTVMLAASPASANMGHPGHECRWDSSANDYRCHGRPPMRSGAERVVPVYIDDDGAPRPVSPMASRGNELPPTDAGRWDETYWIW